MSCSSNNPNAPRQSLSSVHLQCCGAAQDCTAWIPHQSSQRGWYVPVPRSPQRRSCPLPSEPGKSSAVPRTHKPAKLSAIHVRQRPQSHPLFVRIADDCISTNKSLRFAAGTSRSHSSRVPPLPVPGECTLLAGTCSPAIQHMYDAISNTFSW